jgi:hypothetical protein
VYRIGDAIVNHLNDYLLFYRREIMSDKVVGKIFVTSWKNYKKFRDNENNRNLDERHVAKLVASFRKNGGILSLSL